MIYSKTLLNKEGQTHATEGQTHVDRGIDQDKRQRDRDRNRGRVRQTNRHKLTDREGLTVTDRKRDRG